MKIGLKSYNIFEHSKSIDIIIFYSKIFLSIKKYFKWLGIEAPEKKTITQYLRTLAMIDVSFVVTIELRLLEPILQLCFHQKNITRDQSARPVITPTQSK